MFSSMVALGTCQRGSDSATWPWLVTLQCTTTVSSLPSQALVTSTRLTRPSADGSDATGVPSPSPSSVAHPATAAPENASERITAATRTELRMSVLPFGSAPGQALRKALYEDRHSNGK